MTDNSVSVQNLSKKFTIGQLQSGDLRHAIGDKIRGLFKPNATEKEEFWALKDINFEIKHGEAVGIIGRNGAGKSTLLKILSRITEPTKGRFEINGRVSSLLEVGTGFHMELTGRENIFLNGTILGMRRAEIKAKFDEIVAFSGVDKFIDTPVKHYSSGMKVRLAFSVAAHLDPEILIIDEVLAVGDADFQKKCLGKMEDVTSEGRTVIFVSHNMGAIKKLCKRGIILDKSKVQIDSFNISEVVRTYLHHNSKELSNYWKNDGNFEDALFKPIEFSVKKDGFDLYISILGELKEKVKDLTIGYALYDEDHQLIYWSYHNDASKIDLCVGLNSLVSRLPFELLNIGKYTIELIGGIHNKKWFFEPGLKTPKISFIKEMIHTESPYHIKRRPGILSPIIEWTNELYI